MRRVGVLDVVSCGAGSFDDRPAKSLSEAVLLEDLEEGWVFLVLVGCTPT
jgi:hypothetical protein